MNEKIQVESWQTNKIALFFQWWLNIKKMESLQILPDFMAASAACYCLLEVYFTVIISDQIWIPRFLLK